MLSSGSNSSAGEESALRQNEKEVKIASEQARGDTPEFRLFSSDELDNCRKESRFLIVENVITHGDERAKGKLRRPK